MWMQILSVYLVLGIATVSYETITTWLVLRGDYAFVLPKNRESMAQLADKLRKEWNDLMLQCSALGSLAAAVGLLFALGMVLLVAWSILIWPFRLHRVLNPKYVEEEE